MHGSISVSIRQGREGWMKGGRMDDSGGGGGGSCRPKTERDGSVLLVLHRAGLHYTTPPHNIETHARTLRYHTTCITLYATQYSATPPRESYCVMLHHTALCIIISCNTTHVPHYATFFQNHHTTLHHTNPPLLPTTLYRAIKLHVPHTAPQHSITQHIAPYSLPCHT